MRAEIEQVQGKQTIQAYLNTMKKEIQKCNGKGVWGVINYLVGFLSYKKYIELYKNGKLQNKYKEEYIGKGAVGEAMIAGPAGLILGPSTFLRQWGIKHHSELLRHLTIMTRMIITMNKFISESESKTKVFGTTIFLPLLYYMLTKGPEKRWVSIWRTSDKESKLRNMVQYVYDLIQTN